MNRAVVERIETISLAAGDAHIADGVSKWVLSEAIPMYPDWASAAGSRGMARGGGRC